MKRTWINVLIVFLLIFGLLTPGLALPDQGSAATPNDIKDHWAYSSIARGIELGFISGYPDGSFLPDKPVSRAEFSKMMNAALGNNGTESIAFKDVPSFEWFYNDVSKALAATYVDGYEDNTFRPNKAISRQEAAVMIARIVPSYGIYFNLNVFQDGSKTADWATEYVKKIVGKKYLGAYDDGLLHPEDNLTRAQTAKIICNILDNETIVKTPTTIKVKDTVIKNTIYTNGVTISKDLEEADASFQNCSLLGGLFVNGGGKNSITIENSRVAQLNVNKTGSTVRVLVKGATVIPQTSTQELCTLETSSLAGGIFGKGFVSVDIKRNADTIFVGSFPLITMTGSNGIARLENSTVDKLIVSTDAKTSNVHLDNRSTLATTDVNALAAFHGTGTIKHMNANVSGITYETKPTNWTLGKDVVAPKEANPDLKTSFTPEDKATGIALKVTPTITFSTEIETFKGDAVTAAYLKDNLVFKINGTSTNVDFTAALSTNKKVITVTPKVSLDSNKVYYLGFIKDKYRSISSKESIPAKNIIFTTIDTTPTVKITPIDNAVQVGVSTPIVITFSEEIFKSDGKSAIDVAYLAANITVANNSGGSAPTMPTGTISGKTLVTIPAPLTGWTDGTSYTVTVNAGAFKNAAGNPVASTKATFIAGSAKPLLTINSVTPSSNEVEVSASSSIAGTVYFVVIETTDGALEPATSGEIKSIQSLMGSSGPKLVQGILMANTNFTIKGLSPNLQYKVYGFVNGNGQDSTVQVSANFTTPKPYATLNSLQLSYIPSGAAVASYFSVLGSSSIDIPEGAKDISIEANAPIGIVMESEGVAAVTGPDPLTKGITSLGLSVDDTTSITITASGTSYRSKVYTLTLKRVAESTT